MECVSQATGTENNAGQCRWRASRTNRAGREALDRGHGRRMGPGLRHTAPCSPSRGSCSPSNRPGAPEADGDGERVGRGAQRPAAWTSAQTGLGLNGSGHAILHGLPKGRQSSPVMAHTPPYPTPRRGEEWGWQLVPGGGPSRQAAPSLCTLLLVRVGSCEGSTCASSVSRTTQCPLATCQ